MTKANIKKEYTNGEITVVWKPALCIHSEICVKTLPEVYDPNAKPWINVDNATTNDLKAQVMKCPSGALSFYMNDAEEQEVEDSGTKVEVVANGPLLVHGTLEVADIDGNTETRAKRTAFCRCGASKNKPYCDGAHTKVEFKG